MSDDNRLTPDAGIAGRVTFPDGSWVRTDNGPTPETDGVILPPGKPLALGYDGPLAKHARKLERQRDEAREQLRAARVESETLATSIWRAEYSAESPAWGLCDTVAGVISQIDNMYAGVRRQRDEARAEREETRKLIVRHCAARANYRARLDRTVRIALRWRRWACVQSAKVDRLLKIKAEGGAK